MRAYTVNVGRLRRSRVFEMNAVGIELAFANAMHQLDAGGWHGGKSASVAKANDAATILVRMVRSLLVACDS